MLFSPKMMGPETARIVHLGWRIVPVAGREGGQRPEDANLPAHGSTERTWTEGDVSSQVAVCHDDGFRPDLERVDSAMRREGRDQHAARG